MLGKLRRLVEKVNGNAESVTNANAGLSQIAAENSAAITDVSRAIEEIAAGASSQSEQVEHGAGTIQVLSGEIDGLSKKSRETQSVLELASEKIDSGKQQVSGLEASYHKLEIAFSSHRHELKACGKIKNHFRCHECHFENIGTNQFIIFECIYRSCKGR